MAFIVLDLLFLGLLHCFRCRGYSVIQIPALLGGGERWYGARAVPQGRPHQPLQKQGALFCGRREGGVCFKDPFQSQNTLNLGKALRWGQNRSNQLGHRQGQRHEGRLVLHLEEPLPLEIRKTEAFWDEKVRGRLKEHVFMETKKRIYFEKRGNYLYKIPLSSWFR